MTGGSTAKNVGILSRANELKRLQAQYEQVSANEEDCRSRLSQAQRELSAAKYELEVASGELTEASDNFHRWENTASQCRVLQSAADENLESLDSEKNGLSQRLRENRERAQQTQTETQALQAQLEEIRAGINELSGGREEFEKRREELAAQLAQLRSSIASLEAERGATTRSQESLTQLLGVIAGDEEQRRRSIAEIEAKNEEINTRLQEQEQLASQHRQRIEENRLRLESINSLRMELEGKRTQSEKTGQDKNRQMLDMQSVCAKFEQKKLSAEMEESQIVDKLWDSYELSRTAAEELRQPVENMAQSTKRISELRREIGRLGNVNVGAIEEYERVSERYNFLSEQRSDVAKAKRELEKIIGDITGEMKEIFTDQFKAIDGCFRQVFLELFGGGRASLELEDEENVLECGIEIKVQPPGKAVTTISLLSGGEKSFVAIALYFAIMKVRPTPFCIMDEIDAALDEANVIRYAEYMRRMAEKTQFIAITHHRGTMEEADMLYGVTMQEKGVTTVISVDLDEAEKTLN
jgi:chromosome segregation protein